MMSVTGRRNSIRPHDGITPLAVLIRTAAGRPGARSGGLAVCRRSARRRFGRTTRSVRRAVASASRVPDEHLTGAELVAVRAVHWRFGHPTAVTCLAEVTDHRLTLVASSDTI